MSVEGIRIAYPDIAASEDSRELYLALEALIRENESNSTNHVPIICGKKLELAFYKELISRGLEIIEVPEGEDNVVYAGKELSKGNIHAVLAGNISSTGHVVTVGIKEIGMRQGVERSSSYFLMNHPEYGEYIFADSGLQPDPKPTQLIEIVKLTLENARIHGISTKVALLDGGVSSEKMMEVTKYFTENPIPGAEIIGNVSFEQAKQEKCGVFIFPDLNAGNILYKAAERMGDMSVSGQIEDTEANYGHVEFTQGEGIRSLFAYHAGSLHPSAEELFQTSVSSIEEARKRGIKPQVSFLTFSTAGSGKDFPTILPARQAATMLSQYVRENEMDDVVVLEQEVQLDTALLPDKAKKKGMNIKKPSTICIMPDMHSAKMIGGIVDTLGGSTANGPRFQGFKYPIHDFSRGVGVDGITMGHKTTEKELSN